MLSHPFIGAGFYLKGLKLITEPGLRRFVIAPIAINVVVFGALIAVLTDQFGGWVDWAVAQLPTWLDWLEWLIWPLFAIAIAIAVFYTFTMVANLIASPFNGLLAEAVERHLGMNPEEDTGETSLWAAVKQTPGAVMDEIRKLAYFLKFAIPLAILSIIPGLNVVAPFLWALFSSWMMAVEYCGYSMDNHEMRAKEQYTTLRQRKLMSTAFGGVVMVATLIPILNLVVMPAAVAGGTALWAGQLRQTAQGS